MQQIMDRYFFSAAGIARLASGLTKDGVRARRTVRRRHSPTVTGSSSCRSSQGRLASRLPAILSNDPHGGQNCFALRPYERRSPARNHLKRSDSVGPEGAGHDSRGRKPPEQMALCYGSKPRQGRRRSRPRAEGSRFCGTPPGLLRRHPVMPGLAPPAAVRQPSGLIANRSVRVITRRARCWSERAVCAQGVE